MCQTPRGAAGSGCTSAWRVWAKGGVRRGPSRAARAPGERPGRGRGRRLWPSSAALPSLPSSRSLSLPSAGGRCERGARGRVPVSLRPHHNDPNSHWKRRPVSLGLIAPGSKWLIRSPGTFPPAAAAAGGGGTTDLARCHCHALQKEGRALAQTVWGRPAATASSWRSWCSGDLTEGSQKPEMSNPAWLRVSRHCLCLPPPVAQGLVFWTRRRSCLTASRRNAPEANPHAFPKHRPDGTPGLPATALQGALRECPAPPLSPGCPVVQGSPRPHADPWSLCWGAQPLGGTSLSPMVLHQGLSSCGLVVGHRTVGITQLPLASPVT